MISRYFLGAFAMMALVFLYLAWSDDPSWAPFMIPPVLLAAVTYVLSPQLDWWHFQRRPPAVPEGFLRLLSKKNKLWKNLGPPTRKRLLQHMMLYTKAHSFTGKSIKKVPEDAKMVIGFYASLLTLNRGDYLLKPYERIVFYPHPFPSPEVEELHISEHHPADGVLVFALPYVMNAFLAPDQFFQPALYELGRVCVVLWEEQPWPKVTEAHEDHLSIISRFPKASTRKVIGGKEVDYLGLAIHHFFQFPDRFQQELPDLFSELSACFSLDPRHPDLSSI